MSAFPTGADFRYFFKANYGPTITVYQRLASQPDGAEAAMELDAALADLYDPHLRRG